jgi:hypothetical protein
MIGVTSGEHADNSLAQAPTESLYEPATSGVIDRPSKHRRPLSYWRTGDDLLGKVLGEAN